MTTVSERLGGGWLFFLFLLLMMWLPIPYGSNTTWAIALFGIFISILLVFWLILALVGRVRIPRTLVDNRWIILLWLLWLGWIACQLVPLPVSVLQELSPHAASAYLNSSPDKSVTTDYRISIQPELTYQHLLESLSYFALYLFVLLIASSRERLQLLAGVIVLSGLCQAVYGSLMVLTGLEYGFLEPKTAYLGNATGTFVNRNHLAGYLEMCAAVGVGLVVADLRLGRAAGNWRIWLREWIELGLSRKLRVRVFVSVMVIGLVMTRSRMGNTAFFTSLMLCGLLYVFLRERRFFLKSLLLFASFLIIDLLIVSNWFGLEKVVQRVEQTQAATESRTYVLPELSRAQEAYWLTGSGLGTFSMAFLPFRVVQPKYFYDHAHNDYAEFLIETGIIGAAILAALVLATMLHALRVIVSRRNRFRTGMALGGLMAMIAIAVHSVVDFNLQIPANAATLVVIMAMLNSCSHRSERKSRSVRVDEGTGDELQPSRQLIP